MKQATTKAKRELLRLETQARRLRRILADALRRRCCEAMIRRLEADLKERWRRIDMILAQMSQVPTPA